MKWRSGHHIRVDVGRYTPDPASPAHEVDPPLVGYDVLGVDGRRLGAVTLDLRAVFPRNRLVVEHGAWLWRRCFVVARAHVVDVDPAASCIRIDLDRAGLLAMPRWES